MPVLQSTSVLISIHALREEGDVRCNDQTGHSRDFNPRPPRGGRLGDVRRYFNPTLFQSTPSARRATKARRIPPFPTRFQSTPSARRATLRQAISVQQYYISIHALREEGDCLCCRNHSVVFVFQSTPSARRATRLPSIPAVGCNYFNPRPPRGGRLCASASVLGMVVFQSTPSARRATFPVFPQDAVRTISIHALREEGDATDKTGSYGQKNFNPRPPRGGRLTDLTAYALHEVISIHALREEGDSKSGEKIHHVCSIIHTCAQFEKELYEGSGEMQNKSC